MTRDEFRQLARTLGITVPEPEPAYWDELPHLVFNEYWEETLEWPKILQGTYEPILCDGCKQHVWEWKRIAQALISVGEAEYYMPSKKSVAERQSQGGFAWFGIMLCLPCYKAFIAHPSTIYDGTDGSWMEWNLEDVRASEGVFTEAYWRENGDLQTWRRTR